MKWWNRSWKKPAYVPANTKAKALFKLINIRSSYVDFEIVGSDNKDLPPGCRFSSYTGGFKKAMLGKGKNMKSMTINGVLHFEGDLSYKHRYSAWCWGRA